MRQFKKNQLRQEDCSARLLPLVARILHPNLFDKKSIGENHPDAFFA